MSVKVRRIAIALIIIAAVACCAIFIHKNSLRNYQLVDETEYDAIIDEVDAEIESYDSNDSMRESIESWLGSNKIPYESDSAGNIIVTPDQPKNSDKQTIICTDYNYKTASSEVNAQATMRYIAKYQPKGQPYKLIFFNNENNEYAGIQNISTTAFPKNSHVVFLSSAGKMGISVNSFVSSEETVKIPLETTERTCDTGIVIKIDGLTSEKPDAGINGYPNPLTALSTVLTRMNGKSMTYELADVKLGNQGNMYPTSLEASILINSYSLEDMTKYLDKRSEKFVGDNNDDYPDVSYTYEVIEDVESLPEYVYSAKTTESLNNFVYTAKNGSYKFSDEMEIPPEYELDDVYAINCIEELYTDESNITLHLYSAAIDDAYLDSILADNKTVAEFTQVQITNDSRTSQFAGNLALATTISELYPEVNGTQDPITIANPTEFLQCSYLLDIDSSLEIIQLYESDKTNIKITNTLMNYIKTAGEDKA